MKKIFNFKFLILNQLLNFKLINFKFISNLKSQISNLRGGFTLIELVISVAIFSLILMIVISFFLTMNFSSTKNRIDREIQESARRIIDAITYEVKSAKGIYTPTTSSSQLSLETFNYLPSEESSSYIDFFLCGDNLKSLCLKKESQNPVMIHSDTINIESISFSHLLSGGTVSSINISLTVSHKNPPANFTEPPSITLNSTVSTRVNK